MMQLSGEAIRVCCQAYKFSPEVLTLRDCGVRPRSREVRCQWPVAGQGQSGGGAQASRIPPMCISIASRPHSCERIYNRRLIAPAAPCRVRMNEMLYRIHRTVPGMRECVVWKGFPAFPAHLRMRPVSRGNSRRATWVGPQAERPRFPVLGTRLI